jgi:hypothetical protein
LTGSEPPEVCNLEQIPHLGRRILDYLTVEVEVVAIFAGGNPSPAASFHSWAAILSELTAGNLFHRGVTVR